MSRIASPAEKIIAMGATYRALRNELPVDVSHPMIASAMINAALIITMSTDTRSMGILGTDDPGPSRIHEFDDPIDMGLEPD